MQLQAPVTSVNVLMRRILTCNLCPAALWEGGSFKKSETRIFLASCFVAVGVRDEVTLLLHEFSTLGIDFLSFFAIIQFYGRVKVFPLRTSSSEIRGLKNTTVKKTVNKLCC